MIFIGKVARGRDEKEWGAGCLFRSFAIEGSVEGIRFFIFLFYKKGMGKQKWYVIWQGTKTGVFSEWKEVEEFVAGVKGAKYKAFATKQEAETALGR